MADRKNKGQDQGRREAAPRLLSGGNPQIAKGEGNRPVQAYIGAMPGWKHAVGEKVDAVIEDAIPDVRKAVKWNQPFYGAPDREGWFLSYRCYTNYVQLQFFNGTSLDPVPPKQSKHEGVRYLDIREDEGVDEGLLRSWVEQAASLPGEPM